MVNSSAESQLRQIQELIWQQSWDDAGSQCQALLDDPHLSEQVQGEAQRLSREIEEKQRAELTIRETLATVSEGVQSPKLDFDGLRRKLEHAQALEQRYHILRWHSELQGWMDDLRRRKDLRYRLQEDYKAFKDSLENGAYERALEIANKLLEEAEISQQPSLAKSARAWLAQVGTQMHFEQLADSVRQALDRQNYEWASILFDQLPSYSQRTIELAPLVDDARASLRAIQDELESARKQWQADALQNRQAVETLLRDLYRLHPKNTLWRPFWLEFYHDIAMRAGRAGDEAVAGGNFAGALAAYHEKLKALHSLLDVYPEDADLRQQEQVTRIYVEVCGYLGEAYAAVDHRADIVAAQALCRKALQVLTEVPEALQDVITALQQRALDFQQKLRRQEQAFRLLKETAALPADDDLDAVFENLRALGQIPVDLPEIVQQRINALQTRTEQRREKLADLLDQARSAPPDDAFITYAQAWQVARGAALQDEITTLCLSQAEEAEEAGEDACCRTWLERGQQIAPQHPEIQRHLLALSLRPEFDGEFLPLQTQLLALRESAETDTDDIEALRSKFELLTNQFGEVPELRRLVEQALAECQHLSQTWHDVEAAVEASQQLQRRGEWPEAIADLRGHSDKVADPGPQQRLLKEAERLESMWRSAAQAYKQADHAYREALKVYGTTAETHAYDGPLVLLEQASQALLTAFEALDHAMPQAWRRLRQDIEVYVRRVQTLKKTWEARLEPGSLAALVLVLRGDLEGKPADPVATSLLDELKVQALDDLKKRAKTAEKQGRDDQALDALRQALDLGGDDPDLRHWLETVSTRGQRRQRIQALRLDIDKYSKRKGGLQRAVGFQEELLLLLAEDTGVESWVQEIKALISFSEASEEEFNNVVSRIRDEERQEDVAQLEAAKNDFRAALRDTEVKLEALVKASAGEGRAIQSLLDEVGKWLRFKRQLISYDAGTSAGAVKDYVGALKEMQKLETDADDPSLYTDQVENVRERMLEQLRNSTSKRLNEAGFALEQESFSQALASLESIEPEFYTPILTAFSELHTRLTQKGSTEGDLFAEVQGEMQRARRLEAIGKCLEGWESRIKEKRISDPEGALELIQNAVLEDPDKECPKHLARLAALRSQIKALSAEREEDAARAAIRKLEVTVETTHLETDYEAFQASLSEIDRGILDSNYQSRYDELKKKIAERLRLFDLLQRADERFEAGEHTAADSLYRQAFDLQSGLAGFDPGFSYHYQQFKKRIASQDQVQTLVDEAWGLLSSVPEEAIKVLERARAVARGQGTEAQMQEIQRLIYRIRAEQTFEEAERAFETDIPLAKDKAALARRYAEKSEVAELLEEIKAFESRIERQVQAQKIISEQRARTKDLMNQCQWQAALDDLGDADVALDDLIAEIQGKLDEAKKTKNGVKSLIEAGEFSEAERQLTQARVDLILSEKDVKDLRDTLRAAQDQMREWQSRFDKLMYKLASGAPLDTRDLLAFIEEANKLTDDRSAVQGRRNAAEALGRALKGLKLKCETMEKKLQQIDTSKPLKALGELAEIPATYSLELEQTEPISVQHAFGSRVSELRRKSIVCYLARLKAHAESAEDFPVEALRTILADAEKFKLCLETADDSSTFERLCSGIEKALQKKETQAYCEAWLARIGTVRESYEIWLARIGTVHEEQDAGEPPDQLLDVLNTVGEEIKQRCEATPLDTWGKLREVRHDVFALQEKIMRERLQHVRELKDRVYKSVHEALQHGNSIQLQDALLALNALHEDSRLSESDLDEVQSNIDGVQKAITDYEQGEKMLENVRQHLECLHYKEARLVLDKSVPTPLLQETWAALGKVVSRLEAAEDLIAQAEKWYTPESLRAGARESEELLRRFEELRDEWPRELSATDRLGRMLWWEIERIMPQVRDLLAGSVYQQVIFALQSEALDEAEQLRSYAEARGWDVGKYAQRFENLEAEIEIVRAMIALEKALLATEWDSQAQEDLEAHLKKSYTLDVEVRNRALLLLELAEIRGVLVHGGVDEAELRIGNPDLLNVQRPYTAVSREVNKAVTEMKDIKRLCVLLDTLKLPPPGEDWRTKVEEAQQLAQQGNQKLVHSLAHLKQRAEDAAQGLRNAGDYEGLEALNALARQLGLGEPDVVSLRRERDERFKSEFAKAQELLAQDQPEAAVHSVEVAMLVSTPVQHGDISSLQQKLEDKRHLCQEADVLINAAGVDLAKGDYTSAAEKYRAAWEKAPHRASVCGFADRLHDDWWPAFDRLQAEEDFPRAEAIAERALLFGFKLKDWQGALDALKSDRAQRLTALLESIAGPGCREEAGELVVKGGQLSDPDPDLDTAREQLRQACTWHLDSPLLDAALHEVEARLQHMTEARLDVRQGWLALERGDVEKALDHFKLASEHLDREHPEIGKWIRFSELILTAREQLLEIEKRGEYQVSLSEQVEGSGNYLVACPGWEVVKGTLSQIRPIFLHPVETHLLGEEGVGHQREVQPWVQQLGECVVLVTDGLKEMQACYKTGYFDGVHTPHQQVLTSLGTLRKILRSQVLRAAAFFAAQERAMPNQEGAQGPFRTDSEQVAAVSPVQNPGIVVPEPVHPAEEKAPMPIPEEADGTFNRETPAVSNSKPVVETPPEPLGVEGDSFTPGAEVSASETLPSVEAEIPKDLMMDAQDPPGQLPASQSEASEEASSTETAGAPDLSAVESPAEPPAGAEADEPVPDAEIVIPEPIHPSEDEEKFFF